jgi:nucleotide-binding universal stress UspA family protein
MWPHSAPNARRCLGAQAVYKVELVTFSTSSESVGAAVCSRAEELGAVAVVLASHNKSALWQFFQGSVTSYCVQHCRHPLVVLR